jgi:hypothetical protein
MVWEVNPVYFWTILSGLCFIPQKSLACLDVETRSICILRGRETLLTHVNCPVHIDLLSGILELVIFQSSHWRLTLFRLIIYVGPTMRHKEATLTDIEAHRTQVKHIALGLRHITKSAKPLVLIARVSHREYARPRRQRGYDLVKGSVDHREA